MDNKRLTSKYLIAETIGGGKVVEHCSVIQFVLLFYKKPKVHVRVLDTHSTRDTVS